ncbi:HsdR family type I site-specific deoxyribonuclease [Arcobacter sp. KX21116]|uniref:type I restriction endonuclease subunit R n=1 Tax=Arcobacter iocasae TaxID=2906515 RepID=UPI0035D43C99
MREETFVHEPFLKSLEAIDWEAIRLNRLHQTPQQSYRESFKDVVMKEKLYESLQKINPFLDDDQINECINRVLNFSSAALISQNTKIFDLLLNGTSVDENRKTKDKSPTVRYIDFDNKENNSFIAVSEFGVKVKGIEVDDKKTSMFYPDVVLFVNGLPLVVVEAKKPKGRKDALQEAFSDLQNYAQLKAGAKKGNRELFFFNHFLVITDNNQAKFGTITATNLKHFWRWSNPYPMSLDELPRTDAGVVNDQNRLIYGMLKPGNLLEIFQSFTVFSSTESGVEKVVCRHQQFRAVKKAIYRLENGEDQDEKGGLIWHTQGSGKSLTMMFLIRAMYATGKFDEWKILLINDRTDLETQLKGTAGKIGININSASTIAELKEMIKSESSDVVMAMVQKFQQRELSSSAFPVLNKSDKILIMVDEAHRSIYSSLGSNIKKAAPNAVMIGYTGTPIEKSHKLFKDYIDKYTMKESIEDGATLKIVYEGRAHDTELKEGAIVNIYDELEVVDDESDELKGIGVDIQIRKAYLESVKTITTKAKDMLEHYFSHVYPNGYKAQIVAPSQKAAVTYKKVIDTLLKERGSSVKADIVISGIANDDEVKEYGKRDKESITDSFIMKYGETKDGVSGEIGILIVNNMLLTGFDAKIEQVMYIDRVLKAHNLLQAIARVNRVYDEGKSVGFVVDYIGIGDLLKRAVEYYNEKEQEDSLDTGLWDVDKLESELKECSIKINEFIENEGIPIDSYDDWYALFYEDEIRYEFLMLFKEYSQYLDELYPSEKAVDFIEEFKKLKALQIEALGHELDSSYIIDSKKLQDIVDEYLLSKGIKQKVAPIEVFSDEFVKKKDARKSSKAKAAEIENALMKHINLNMEYDPTLYSNFLEMLKKILEQFKENWDEIYKQLEALREKLKQKEEETFHGLKKEYKPYFNLFSQEIFGKIEDLSEDEISLSIRLTKDITAIIEAEETEFLWSSNPAKARLRMEIQDTLLGADYVGIEAIAKKYKTLILQIMNIAEPNKNGTKL